MSRILLPLTTAVLLVIPVVCQSKDVSIPEVGIEFPAAPENASTPMVHLDAGGDEGIVRIGEALVVAYRSNNVVTAGAALTDEAFRANAQSLPELINHSQSKGRPASLAGQPAWAFYDAYNAPHFVEYVLVVYAIVDAHLYILQVNAHAPSKKPPDFDAAVLTLQNVRFSAPNQPVRQMPHPVAERGPPVLPRVRNTSKQDFYPPPAQRLGVQGEVDLEFRIDDRGHTRDVQQTYAAARDLGASAEHLVETAIFDVPRDWTAKGSDKLRFRVEVQFTLRCHAYSDHTYPPRVAGDEIISVCAAFRQ